MTGGAKRLLWLGVTLLFTALAVLLLGPTAVLVFALGILLVFSLFVGTDHLLASFRGRTEPAFDWFDGTPWSGRATAGKRVATRAATVLAAVFIVLAVLGLILLVIGLLLGLLTDLP
jgi:hypothetical protein